MTTQYDITEGIPYDLSTSAAKTSFALTNIAYDIVIDDLPFIVKVNNQDPYRRETAQYRKDQFDNSTEPGEQSLTGWWLRSQTSWHNGAGIAFYEPGTDYQHVSHRFADSRGINIWTIGEATLLNDVFHSYTGANGIISCVANDGTNDIMISGDSAGKLKKITFNDDSVATVGPDPSFGYTLFVSGLSPTTQAGHNSTYAFKSVTTDGSKYFAACSTSIHRGGTSISDEVIYHLSATPSTNSIVLKYVKNNLLLGFGQTIYKLDASKTAESQHTGNPTTIASITNKKFHTATGWQWNDIVAGNTLIYASGKNNSKSEIWGIPYNASNTDVELAAATMMAEMPFGEHVNAMYFYLGALAIATNKGIRIADVATDGSLVVGPLLVDTKFEVTGFVANDKYIWASTAVLGDNGNDNGCLIRIDLSTQFDDGTYAWAYDLQYESDKDSYCTGVHYANKRLHLIINEPTESPAGEIQTENLSLKRASGWLQTGKIRYGTIEPKFFRYINVQCNTGQGDNIVLHTITKDNTDNTLATLSEGLSNQDIFINNPSSKQEFMAFKFVLNNATDDQDVPVLSAYQIKAVPATRRQRLYQFPLSCFDTEMDRYSSVFGYKGRALEFVQRLEGIEETGKFVDVIDYRTGETFQGVIEEVRFTNESSPDKDSSGFGGVLLVTVRKM